MSDKESLFQYICDTIIPLISTNILCTYLSKTDSYVSSIIYVVSLKLAILLFPILPILNWFVYGSISVLSSVIVYLLYKYIIIKDQTYFKRSTKLHEKISYTLSLIFSILLVCFMLGLFKYNAISILSNSMQPVFSRGDVIVYKQFTEKDINLITPNTIIIYSLGDQYIAHRVINVIKENNNIYFQTKGDNNNTPDFFKVKIEQIKGIYAFHIKYLGFPSVWLHDYLISDIPLVQSP